MPPKNSPRKAPKPSKKARVAKGKPTRPARKGARKSKAATPGTRDVFRRRVTTYDLTLDEKAAFEKVATRKGKSVSEMLAFAARAVIAEVQVAEQIHEQAPSDATLGAASRQVAERLMKAHPGEVVQAEPSAADDAARELAEGAAY